MIRQVKMDSIKLDPQLGLALSLSPEERSKSDELSLGYDDRTQTWELVIQYVGDIRPVLEKLDVPVVFLMGDYALIQIAEKDIERLLALPEIAYVEKPRSMTFEQDTDRSTEILYAGGTMEGISASCIPTLRRAPFHLTGAGTLICIADSGIDYTHRAFRNKDGTTRILGIWDQTIDGKPPDGFYLGSFYSEEEINQALRAPSTAEARRLVPSVDTSGHGTHVAGIAAGSNVYGAAGNTVFSDRVIGVAPEASLLIIKLGNKKNQAVPKTTELMQAVTFAKRFADRRELPLSVNLSFGNNYGAHDGTALLERYLDSVAATARISITVGTGNDGASARHVGLQLTPRTVQLIEWAVAPYETSLNLQIWKPFADDMAFVLIAPDGRRHGPFGMNEMVLSGESYVSYRAQGTNIEIYQGLPTPYNQTQQIFLSFLPMEQSITEGIWQLEITTGSLTNGAIELYLPVAEGTSTATGFLRPSADGTLTIPSTASRVISVAAYNSITGAQTAFSGRGFTSASDVKPDLAAPGVDINSAAPGGGYSLRTGTSMAAPFVAGSAALLMQWGIVDGRDPYLYGERLRAYLIRGAKRIDGYFAWPNPQLGWGKLCVRDSLPGEANIS